jgi:hypothetical protein
MTRRVRETQWMFHLLVHGFDLPPCSRSSDRVRTFRQERLKHMVLRNLFEDYAEQEYRFKTDGASLV